MAKTMKKEREERKTIGINVTQELADEIETRASSMYFTSSKYCKVVLMTWLESGEKLELIES